MMNNHHSNNNEQHQQINMVEFGNSTALQAIRENYIEGTMGGIKKKKNEVTSPLNTTTHINNNNKIKNINTITTTMGQQQRRSSTTTSGTATARQTALITTTSFDMANAANKSLQTEKAFNNYMQQQQQQQVQQQQLPDIAELLKSCDQMIAQDIAMEKSNEPAVVVVVEEKVDTSKTVTPVVAHGCFKEEFQYAHARVKKCFR